jgi:hypothetical protein
MKNLSPGTVADNWQKGMANSSAALTAGVQAVTVNPADQAIAAIPRMVAGVQAAAADGRIERGLRRTTLQSWQTAMIQKGAPRIATGANAAKPKMVQFFTQMLPFQQQLVSTLPPRGDTQQNIQRAVAMMNGMSQFKYVPQS